MSDATQTQASASNPFFEGIKSTASGLFGALTSSIERAGAQAIPIWVNRQFGSDQDTRQLQDTTFRRQFAMPRIEDTAFFQGPPTGGAPQPQKAGFTTGIGVAAGLGFAAVLALVLLTRK